MIVRIYVKELKVLIKNNKLRGCKMMKHLPKSQASLLTVSLLASSILMSTIASAQIEEIVVTSTKRETTLQDIPVAVSVTSAEEIKKAQIIELKDLQSVVPSLKINTLQSSANTNFIIRGFGNGANNPGIEPSVGVFIDGVYRSRSAASITDLPNLERVEVLRGPQSTLFGKNASAGVISVVTAKPTGEFGGNVSATVGNFDEFILKGQIGGSISETVAFDIAGSTNTRDGYFENLVTGNTLNDKDRQAFRGQLLWDFDDATEVRVIADFDQFDERCCGVNNLFVSPTEQVTNALTGAQLIPNDPFALEGFTNIDPTTEVENAGLSLHFDRDFSNFTFSSISSFRTVESDVLVDVDFTSADNATNSLDTEIDTLTQEYRLTSNTDGPFQWMVGGYYFDESIEHNESFDFGNDFRTLIDAVAAGLGQPGALSAIEGVFGLPQGSIYSEGDGLSQVNELDNEAISVFGQIDYQLTNELALTLGLNYTRDEKEVSIIQTQGSALGGLPLGLLGIAPDNPLILFPAFQELPNAIEDNETVDEELTYTFRLAYDINDAVNIYGGVSTGFNASSWELGVFSTPTAEDVAALQAAGIAVPNLEAGSRFASPEEATVFELGLKAKFNRGAFNITVFDQEIENFQSNIFIGSGFLLANAEEQSVTGVEFDITYYPIDNLQLNLSASLLDPEFDSFTNGPGIGGPADLSGTDPGGIHGTSLSLGATYNFNVGNSDAYIRGDFQYEDDIPTNSNVPADISREEFTLLNLSAGFTTASGFGAAIWGRNVTDDESTTTGFPTPAGTGGFFGYRNQPRTYGITLSQDF